MSDINVQEIAENALKEVNEDNEIREGTPMHDVFVKAGSLLFKKYQDEFDRLRTMTFLENYDEMSRDEMDAHASNYYVERNDGRPAVGMARLLFSEARSFFLPEGEVFVTENETRFLSSEDVELTKNEMQNQTEGDFFYVDVPVESEVNGEGNGEILANMENAPTGLLRIKTEDAPAGGVASESNEELHQKINEKIGTRDLVQDESIRSQLFEEFPFITSIKTIGMGDEEMNRDTLPFICDDVNYPDSHDGNFHIGMHTDVYLKFQQMKQTIDIVDLASEEVPVSENNDDSRYLDVDISDIVEDGALALQRSCIVNPGDQSTKELLNGSGGSTGTGTTGQSAVSESGACQTEFPLGSGGDEGGITFRSQDPTKMFSARANNKLVLPKGKIDNNGNLVTDNQGEIVGTGGGPPNNEKVISLNYFYTPELKIVQNFFENEENRSTVSDLMARHLIPAFIDIFMEYKGNVQPSIIQSEFFEMIYRGNFVEVSDLVASAYDLGANSIRMDTFQVDLEVHNKKGEVIVNDQEIEDKLTFDHPDTPPEKIRTLLPRDIEIVKV